MTNLQPHTLIKLNDLPHTALTTHPTVIHTRKYLLLAPSKLREGSIRPDDTVDLTSRWGGDDDERTAERRMKRYDLSLNIQTSCLHIVGIKVPTSHQDSRSTHRKNIPIAKRPTNDIPRDLFIQ